MCSPTPAAGVDINNPTARPPRPADLESQQAELEGYTADRADARGGDAPGSSRKLRGSAGLRYEQRDPEFAAKMRLLFRADPETGWVGGAGRAGGARRRALAPGVQLRGERGTRVMRYMHGRAEAMHILDTNTLPPPAALR